MQSSDERWLDAEAGPLIRPYALTRGRTQHVGEAFDLLATVVVTGSTIPETSGLVSEHVAVLELAMSPTTVIDIASDMDLPLGVVRVLLADLRGLGLIAIRAPVIRTAPGHVHPDILEAVLHGLRRL